MGNLIHETESFFKTRDKEYQETIGQIEVRARALEPLVRFLGCEVLMAVEGDGGAGLVGWCAHKFTSWRPVFPCGSYPS